jgi:hypothetical protein
MRTIEMAVYAWRWLLGLLPSRPEPVPRETAPTDRQALFDQLRTLRERRRMEGEQSQRDIDNLAARWRAAQTIADETQRELSDTQQANFSANLRHSAAEDRLLKQIKEKSSMLLELFIAEVQDELDALNRTEATIMPRADRNYVTMKKTMGIDSNGPSLKRRAGALIAARQRAEAMRLENLTISAVNSELLRLRKAIPAVTNETIFNERAAIFVAP